MISLRPHQERAIDALRAAAGSGADRLLLVAPTGFGKTHVFTAAALGHVTSEVPDARVLVVVHRRELVRQSVARLRGAGLSDVGVVQADTGAPDASARVIVASHQTLVARGERPRATCLIWDEAHHCMATTFREVAASYPDALHIGATATPQRGDGAPLGDAFQVMVVGATIRELTAGGWLVPSDLIAPPSDPGGKGLWKHPLEAYREHAPGSAAVVFAGNVKHARTLAAEFSAAGYPAACVDGKTGEAERDSALERFDRGELCVLTNVFCLTEGWDCPRAATCIIARSCGTTATYLQMVGRALRTYPGKRAATVIDLCSVCDLHGLPDEDRKWSLDGTAVVRTESMIHLRRCVTCLAIFRKREVCPRCGARAETAEKIVRVLNRAEKMEKRSHLSPRQQDARVIRQLVWVASTRMRMPRSKAEWWARKRFVERFGRAPVDTEVTT